jgi:chromosome segregation ATPase
MQSGNGTDLPAVYQLLQEVAQRVVAIERRLDDHTLKLNELVTATNQHSRTVEDLSAGLRELRSSVDQYHGAVIGHGIDLTRLGERVNRIEDHLQLGPIEVS